MAFSQCEVWWGPAPHKSSPAYRPWVIVSDSSHPFAHEECLVLGMTTQQHPDGITVPDDAWVQGGSKTAAYISPWYAATVKHRDLDNQQGVLDRPTVAAAIEALHLYTALPDD
ncbi:MAG: hypothetical protein ABEI77_01860 [Halorientalis sp.]